jgi:hypothetical protein
MTQNKPRNLSTWDEWKAGEIKQLDQMHSLQMYGEPYKRPPDAIVLRLHWQYTVKQNEEQQSQNCCDGSKRAAPQLHAVASTYSSCVEQPIQQLFFALSAQEEFQVYGGDAVDAYAHSPPSPHATYVAVDDAYIEWFHLQFPDKTINRNMVLPVQHALQGHPESGGLWERHINTTNVFTPLNLRETKYYCYDRLMISPLHAKVKKLPLRYMISSESY